MNSKISVLMGAYNEEMNIADAVQTIEEQTVADIEFIICDDGSTDSTYEILQDLSRKYENIILLRNEMNQGLAYSLNRCFDIATGEYIARMDCDDRCKPERFEYQRAFLESHQEYDLVGCGMIMVDDNGKETFSRLIRIPTVEELPLRVPFSHPTVLMRKSVLDRLGGYKVEKYTRRCEDLELWYRFFYLGMKGYNMPEYLYIKNEGIDDYRRRKVIYGWEMFHIHLQGLRLVHAPVHKYLLAIKPFLTAMIPKRMMMFYHGIVFRDRQK